MAEPTGKLYLVATPLGNLEDITRRALRVLAEVDLIAAEDTRRTLQLLNHFQIKKRLISYYRQKEAARTTGLLAELRRGQNVALVSDAGMPGISDPGQVLVQAAINAGITVIPIPGAAALITALAASGLDSSSFWFEGFLPRKPVSQRAQLQAMVNFPGTLIFYEAPHRLRTTLKSLREVMGERPAVLARELTKIHEEFIRGRLGELLDWAERQPPRGEFTILVAGNDQPQSGHSETPAQDLDFSSLPSDHKETSRRGQLKKLARQAGKSPQEVYDLYLASRKDKN